MESIDYLAHHGIKGQKWGIRRFQNEDGSLTPEGMRRYGVDSDGRMSESGYKRYLKDQRKDTVETYHANKKDIRKNFKGLSKEERQAELKSRYGSEEEYENARAEYRKHQGQKAVAISLGSIGAAVITAGAVTAIATGVVNKGKETAHNNQVTAIVNEGQQITDRLVQLQDEEKQLRLAKHRIKEGVIENTTDFKYEHITDAGGIFEHTPGVINNKGALYSFNYKQYDPKKMGQQVDKKEAVNQALGLNKKEQAMLQEKINYLSGVLDDMSQKKNKRKIIVGGLYKGMQHSEWIIADENYLAHHGIKGQKWGIRRYQNEDGSLTPEGIKRYGVDQSGNMSKNGAARYYRDIYKNAKDSGLRGQDAHNNVRSHFNSEEEYQAFLKNYRAYKGKKAAIAIGAGVAGAALAGTGIYLIAKNNTPTKRAFRSDLKKTEQLYGTGVEDLYNLTKNRGSIAGNANLGFRERSKARQEESIAASHLKKSINKANKTYLNDLKGMDATPEVFNKAAQNEYAKVKAITGTTKADNMLRKAYTKRADALATKAADAAKRNKIVNMKMSALDEVVLRSGEAETKKQVKDFANSFVGKITKAGGAAAGGAIVGGAALVGKTAVNKLMENTNAKDKEEAGRYMFPNPNKKD